MNSRFMKIAGLCGMMTLILLIGCQNSTEPVKSTGSVTGLVLADGSPVTQAFIISDTDLLAVTGSDGTFTIEELQEGAVTLICSAINYSDAVIDITVIGDETVTQNFSLTADSTIGRIYGELQDQTLMDSVLAVQPEISSWTGKQIFEGTTGATLQTKWLHYEVPERKIFIGDSLIAYSDGFGQFWTRMQSGTYPLTVTCEGYHTVTKVVRILADDRVYTSIIMKRTE